MNPPNKQYTNRKRNKSKMSKELEENSTYYPVSNKNLINKINMLMKARDEDRILIRKLNIKVNNLHFENTRQNQDILKLNNTIKKKEYEIYNLNMKNMKSEEKIYSLELKLDEYVKGINELILKEERHKAENDILRRKIEECNKRISYLEDNNKKLKDENEPLSDFILKAKIRKLLKNLLEYLLNKYYIQYMKYDDKENKVKFHSSPIFIFGEKDEKIIKALNEILNVIFIKSKEYDHTIHFVDVLAKFNKKFRKKFKFSRILQVFSHILAFQCMKTFSVK